jgi:ATP-dependent helicase/nuclease subunit B
METAYLAQGFDAHNLSRERVRLRQAASDIVDWMALRRADGWEYAGAENTAEMTIDALDFTLSCRADLIEKSADGFAIIDYKTGQPASEGVVQAGFDLQLPLTAELLQQGAFKDIKAGQTSQLLYVQVRGAGHKTRTKHLTLPDNRKGWSAADYQASAMDVLTKLVRAYDDPDTPYYSQPRIQFANDYGDYDHLARRGEWASLGEESGGE